MSHQSSIFAGIMRRTTSQILDVTDANLWVMDRKTQYFDEVKALTDEDLYRVRGVPGIEWAVPLFKGQPRAKALDGNFRVVIMMGVDDATLVGAPMLLSVMPFGLLSSTYICRLRKRALHALRMRKR